MEEDDDDVGISGSSQRFLLMQKLQRKAVCFMFAFDMRLCAKGPVFPAVSCTVGSGPSCSCHRQHVALLSFSDSDFVSNRVTQGDRVVLLRNMVGPAEVDAELEGEVSEECAQFGKVERVVVYQVWLLISSTQAIGTSVVGRSAMYLTCHCELQEPGNDMDDEGGSVKIFVQFEDAEMAQRAQQALNGRWFGGRMVCFSSRYQKELKQFQPVSIYPESVYTLRNEC
jgi:hypothetical protein